MIVAIEAELIKYTFNRTSLESKRLRSAYRAKYPFLLLIEPVWNRNDRTNRSTERTHSF